MKLAEKQGAAALALGSQYRGLIKTAKGQVDKLYSSATGEFKSAFGTVGSALAITNNVAGMPTIPGAREVLKQLPAADAADVTKVVGDLTKKLPVGEQQQLLDDVAKNLPLVGELLGGGLL